MTNEDKTDKITKEIFLTVQPRQFLTLEAAKLQERKERGEQLTVQEEDYRQDQMTLVNTALGTSHINVNVNLSLKLEDFLYDLFCSIEPPRAPLKLAAHQKYLTEIAEKLNLTVQDPQAMPVLTAQDLSKIRHLVEEDEEFDKLKLNFHLAEAKDEGGFRTVPVNSKLIGVSPAFVSTLARLFSTGGGDLNGRV
jgi:hypothetical protein